MEDHPVDQQKLIASELVANAAEAAKKIINDATDQASRLVAEAAQRAEAVVHEENQKSDDRVTLALSDALRDVFGENSASGRFIDVGRIPLICQSILNINANLNKMTEWMDGSDKKYASKEEFGLVQKIVFGCIALILVAFVGAVIGLVLIK